jgi:peptidoglycan hydrolase CwlO-like protein
MCDSAVEEPPAWPAGSGLRWRPVSQRRSAFGTLLLASLCLSVVLSRGAVRAEPAKPDAAAGRLNPAEVAAQFNAIADAQRDLAGTLAQLRDQLNEAQRALSDLRDEVRQDREAFQAEVEQTKEMREEVRGLYVESSGLKGDIAQLGQRVESFEHSLGSFRLSSGIVVAVVIVLQVVLLGLTFRSHG